MTHTVSELLDRLCTDPWRATTAFSADLLEAHGRMFASGVSGDEIASVLRAWLQKKYQPCLFGRIAAREDLLSYCILTEPDLRRSDESIRDKIQDARLRWTRDGFAGRKSGFIILAVAPRIAQATPDAHLQALAQRLCSLYLLRDIAVDSIYHDELFLELPGDDRATWKWQAGVNYFCANADGRWWQDHRIPGGLAFSMNSVGHLARTGAIARALSEMEQTPARPADSFVGTKVDSLDKALEFAMRTIALASPAVSGKATALLPLPDDGLPAPQCPFALPAHLLDREFRHYQSYYHTDFTIPAEYFLPNVQRPPQCKAQTMDLTYLFNGEVDNPDHMTTAAGRRIRGRGKKTPRVTPILQPIAASEMLLRALSQK